MNPTAAGSSARDSARRAAAPPMKRARARRSRREAPFNLWTALLGAPEVLMYFTTAHLDPHDLLGLYAICKDFHRRVNHHITAYIRAAARAHTALLPLPAPAATIPQSVLDALKPAPVVDRETDINGPRCAADVLPFASFREYCQADPMGYEPGHIAPKVVSRNHRDRKGRMVIHDQITDPTQGLAGRSVPSFRYLFYIRAVSDAARAVLFLLWTQHGLRVPEGTLEVMLKMAFLMHCRLNAARIGLLHNNEWLSDRQLWLALNLIMKIDMAFTDPFATNKCFAEPRVAGGEDEANNAANWRSKRTTGRGLREMLLSFPNGWHRLAKVLARQRGWRSHRDMMRNYVEYCHVPHKNLGDKFLADGDRSIMGVPFAKVGWAIWEYGPDKKRITRLLGIEEGIHRESARRQLRMGNFVLDMLLGGFNETEAEVNHPAQNDDVQMTEAPDAAAESSKTSIEMEMGVEEAGDGGEGPSQGVMGDDEDQLEPDDEFYYDEDGYEYDEDDEDDDEYEDVTDDEDEDGLEEYVESPAVVLEWNVESKLAEDLASGPAGE